jgi:hypothetical protein
MKEAKLLMRVGWRGGANRAYRLKAWVCILLGRTPEVKAGREEVLVAWHNNNLRRVEAPIDADAEAYWVSSMRVVTVGKGLFSNWWYDLYDQQVNAYPTSLPPPKRGALPRHFPNRNILPRGYA